MLDVGARRGRPAKTRQIVHFKPRPNAVKFFSSIELIGLLADTDWLDDATKTIVLHWRRKNARRNGVILENQPMSHGG